MKKFLLFIAIALSTMVSAQKKVTVTLPGDGGGGTGGIARTELADTSQAIRLELSTTAAAIRAALIDSSLAIRGDFPVFTGVTQLQLDDTANDIRTTIDLLAARVTTLEGGGAITPDAPTSPVTDDVANTFDWTNTAGYTAVSDYEITENSGSTFATATAKPHVVGDVNKAIGEVGVRVKAAGGNNPSSVLYSTSAFTTGALNAIAIIQIGQSNNVGRAASDANAVTVPSGVYEYKPSTNTVIALVDPTGEGAHAATDASMNPNLGKRVKELTGADVYILPLSLGNTSSVDWNPEISGGYFEQAVTDLTAFLAYCSTNAITIDYVFAHLLQGENDAGARNSEEYYYRLNRIVDGMINTMNSEVALVTRIGYDPAYADASESEEIMKGQKILDILRTDALVTTNQTATFTEVNSKMKADGVHYTLLGLNEVAEAIAQDINSIVNGGSGVVLPSEPVTSLQGLTANTAELNRFEAFGDAYAKDWLFNFSGNILEADGDVTPSNLNKTAYPSDQTVIPASPTFDADGIVMDKSSAVKLSVPFRAGGDFDVEFRYKASATPAWTAMFGDEGLSGGYGNKIQLDYSGSNLNDLFIGSSTGNILWQGIATEAVSSFVKVKLTRVSNSVTLFINDVQFGSPQTLAGIVDFSWIGAGAANAGYDFSGTVDYVRLIKDGTAPSVVPEPTTSWRFDFSNNLNEADGDIAAGEAKDLFGGSTTPVYDSDGIVLNEYGVQMSDTFVATGDFSAEIRFKPAVAQSMVALLGIDLGGGYSNRLRIEYDASNNINYAIIGSESATADFSGFAAPAVGSFVTLKVERISDSVSLYIDGVQRGVKKNLQGAVSFRWLGMGANSGSLNGVIDYIELTELESGGGGDGGLGSSRLFVDTFITAPTVKYLRADSTFGSMSEGSYTLTLAADMDYNVGDVLIIPVGYEAGLGMPGTLGAGGAWPNLIYEDSLSMFSDITRAAGTYAGNLEDGYAYRYDAVNETWNRYTQWYYYTEKIIPKAYRAKVQAVSPDGLTLTMSKAAVVSVTGAPVFYDNYYYLDSALNYRNRPDGIGVVETFTFPTSGRYAIGAGNIEIQKNSADTLGSIVINGNNATVFSPDGTPSVTISAYPKNITIYDLNLHGNFRDKGFGFSWWGKTPDQGNIPPASGYWENPYEQRPGISLFGKYGYGYNLHVKNTPAYGLQVHWNSFIENSSVYLDDGIRAYTGWQILALNAAPIGTDSAGFRNIDFWAPYISNGMEAARSVGVVFDSITIVNGLIAMNTTGGCVLKNSTVTFTENSKIGSAINFGHPMLDINGYMAILDGADNPLQGGFTLHNTDFIQQGFVDPDSNTLRAISAGAEVVNLVFTDISYTRPDSANRNAIFIEEATNNIIDGFVINGLMKYAGDGWTGNQHYADIGMVNDDGSPGTGEVKNVTGSRYIQVSTGVVVTNVTGFVGYD